MTPRLPPVLSAPDFSEAELAALLLDGEVYRVDECVSPIDEIPDARLRAAALVAQLPPRLIVEQRSAAWVWGALLTPPRRHEVCADIGARTRPADGRRLVVREVVISDEDIARCGELKVTTPLRTATDIARFSTDFNDNDAHIVIALMSLGGFSASACADSMGSRRNLPNKRIALERLAHLAS